MGGKICPPTKIELLHNQQLNKNRHLLINGCHSCPPIHENRPKSWTATLTFDLLSHVCPAFPCQIRWFRADLVHLPPAFRAQVTLTCLYFSAYLPDVTVLLLPVLILLPVLSLTASLACSYLSASLASCFRVMSAGFVQSLIRVDECLDWASGNIFVSVFCKYL